MIDRMYGLARAWGQLRLVGNGARYRLIQAGDLPSDLLPILHSLHPIIISYQTCRARRNNNKIAITFAYRP
jgi:hypothetical protein